MIAKIARQFSAKLSASIGAGGTEPEIIRRFTSAVSSIPTSSRFSVESIFVHQKPYAFFQSPPSICGRIKTELGDILLITKRIRSGDAVDHRFTFLQAKKLARTTTPIEVHQFKFYRDISFTKFKFGNSVYPTGVKPLIWSSLTKSSWFGNYLFLNSSLSTCARTSLIDTQYPGGCSSFPFGPPSWPWPFVGSPHLGIYDFEHFMLGFLKFRGFGVAVSPKTLGFLDIILKRVGWVVDPPEETEEFFEEEKRGFSVIRVTIKDDDEGEQ